MNRQVLSVVLYICSALLCLSAAVFFFCSSSLFGIIFCGLGAVMSILAANMKMHDGNKQDKEK